MGPAQVSKRGARLDGSPPQRGDTVRHRVPLSTSQGAQSSVCPDPGPLCWGIWRSQVSWGREPWRGGSVRGQSGPWTAPSRGGGAEGLSQHKLNTFKRPFGAHLTKGDLVRNISSIFLSEGRRKSQTKQTRHPRGAFVVVEDTKGSLLLPLNLLSHGLDHRLHHPSVATYRGGRAGSGTAGRFAPIRAECGCFWWPLSP